MADRFAVELTLGGPLTPETGEKLKETLVAEQVFVEYGGGTLPEEELDSYLQRCIAEQTPACFCHDEQPWGEFAALEQFCRRHGLTYRRWTEGKYEYEPELVQWRPGMENPQYLVTDHSGRPVVPVDELQARLPQSGNRGDRALDYLRRWLAAQAPIAVPPLRRQEPKPVIEDGANSWGSV